MKIDEEVPIFIFTDPNRLKQILLNLVGNAIKFTFEGHVKIHVSLGSLRAREVNRDILFQIIDTGIGMEPTKTALIFD